MCHLLQPADSVAGTFEITETARFEVSNMPPNHFNRKRLIINPSLKLPALSPYTLQSASGISTQPSESHKQASDYILSQCHTTPPTRHLSEQPSTCCSARILEKPLLMSCTLDHRRGQAHLCSNTNPVVFVCLFLRHYPDAKELS